MTTDTSTVVRDVRACEIDARVRHQTILATLDGLEPGQAIRLLVDHDPKPLFYMLQAERAGRFDWQPEREGPQEWSIVVARLAGHSCC